MPKWWDYNLDIPFLIGADRYGLLRSDLFVEDAELPFKEIHQEFLASLEKRKELNIPAAELVDNKFEDKFWMKDSAAVKRLEVLVDLSEKVPKPKRTPRAKKDLNADPISEEGLTKNLKLRIKLSNQDTNNFGSSPKKRAKITETFSSGGDTDEMLETVSKLLSMKKPKLKDPEMIPPFDMSEQMLNSEIERLKKTYVESGSFKGEYIKLPRVSSFSEISVDSFTEKEGDKITLPPIASLSANQNSSDFNTHVALKRNMEDPSNDFTLKKTKTD